MDEGTELRFMTVEQVNALLPEIEATLEEMDPHIVRRGELNELVEDMEAYWGEGIEDDANPEHEEYLRLQSDLEETTSTVDDYVVSIHQLGGHLKSPEHGLVDFYCILDGKPVFLCWKRGEGQVRYYHELDAGFRGRKPLAP